MDVLSDVLSWLRVEGTLTRRSELTAPWGISYTPTEHFSLMMVEKGSCVMTLETGERLGLESGDVVMRRPGTSGTMSDGPDTPTRPYSEVLEEATVLDAEAFPVDGDVYPTLSYGGGGRLTAIRGWAMRFESYEAHPLLSLLPNCIHISYEHRSVHRWLDASLRFMSHESNHREDGSDMMVVRIAELVFVQLIRAWLHEQPEGQAGWLGALRDKSVRHALKLIHQYPAQPWTVESLGREVGMSRSNFAARFNALVGSSPLKYLTQLRMHLAANHLKSDVNVSLAEVAAEVGYDTESSFGRAFKRYFAVSPGVFRKRELARQSRGT